MELILDYGSCKRSHGAEVYYLDKRGRYALERELGKKRYAHVEDQLNIYVVEDTRVITVAHRTKRIKR